MEAVKLMKKVCVIVFLLFFSSMVNAESRLPFMKHLAGEQQLPRPWGLSIDYYDMEQNYALDSLVFQFPGLSVDPNLLDVTNDIKHIDIKLDAWVLPFLNVFVIAGQIDGDTNVDISRSGLPLPFSEIPVSYDGDVYGGGATLVAGGDVYFGSLTLTYSDADIGGDFNSSVESVAIQPRVGIRVDKWQLFVGGMWLQADESHSGTITIPFLGSVPFDVELSEEERFNYGVGVHRDLGEHFEFTLDAGFGDREHILANIGYRF